MLSIINFALIYNFFLQYIYYLLTIGAMKHRKIVIFVNACIVIGLAYAQELSPIVKIYQFAAADSFLVGWKWITALDNKKISDWAKTYHCGVNDDDKPIVDGTAWFISKYGSTLIFDNLYDDKYFLHINFVTFDNPAKANIDALCIIYCNHKPVKQLAFRDMTAQNSKITLEITREYIVNKKLTVEFKEYSSAGGFFGVWDVLLSKLDTLPNSIKIQKSQQEQKTMSKPPAKLVKPKTTKK